MFTMTEGVVSALLEASTERRASSADEGGRSGRGEMASAVALAAITAGAEREVSAKNDGSRPTVTAGMEGITRTGSRKRLKDQGRTKEGPKKDQRKDSREKECKREE